MTVPDAVSVVCQLERHSTCLGVAMNVLTDRPSPCKCLCHGKKDRA